VLRPADASLWIFRLVTTQMARVLPGANIILALALELYKLI